MKFIILALSLLLAANAAAQSSSSSEPPQVIVSGEGIVKVAPDRAWVSIGAESRSKVSKEAQQRNADAMTAVQQKIAAFGIPKDAIKTTAIDLQLEFDYANGRQTPRGYVARNTLEVRVDQLARLGELLDAVVASGATMIHGVRFDTSKRAELEQAALQSAVANAMTKAQAVAAGAKRAVDRILKIEESFSGGGEPPRPMMRMAAEAASVTPVEAGEIEIRAQVRLTVAIR